MDLLVVFFEIHDLALSVAVIFGAALAGAHSLKRWGTGYEN